MAFSIVQRMPAFHLWYLLLCQWHLHLFYISFHRILKDNTVSSIYASVLNTQSKNIINITYTQAKTKQYRIDVYPTFYHSLCNAGLQVENYLLKKRTYLFVIMSIVHRRTSLTLLRHLTPSFPCFDKVLQRHQNSATDYCKIFHKIIPYVINSIWGRVSIGSHHLCLWTLLFCFRLSNNRLFFGMILFTFIFFMFWTASSAPCVYTPPYRQHCTIQQRLLKNLQEKF